MPIKSLAKFNLVVLVLLIFSPVAVLAVPPPDFAFNILPQLWQTLSLTGVFLVGSLITLWQTIKIKSIWFWQHKIFTSIIIVSFVGVGAFGVKLYMDYLQNQAYQNWVAESQKQPAEAVNSTPVVNESKAETQSQANIPNGANISTLPPITSSEPKTNLPINSTNTSLNSNLQQFFKDNQSTPLLISNSDFKAILSSKQSKPYILDAREDEEYEIGHFPEVAHIRMADLFESRWVELPKDKPIYVFCWSGIRGKEVAEFLRSKQVLGIYFEDGASGWFKDKGDWIGDIAFKSKYFDERYSIVFKKDDILQFQKQNVILVDSRKSEKYNKKHIKGSINLPTLYTPTADLDKIISQIPKGSKVVTVCDEYVNCFDARITGIKLEKAGMIFLGRYNQPWELS